MPLFPMNPAPGQVVQVVDTVTTAVASGTTIIPHDDTIPQITEGTEFMTLAITPKSTTNKLVIDVSMQLQYSIAAFVIGALFQDATANALAAVSNYVDTATGTVVINFRHTMAAGTLSSTTFRARAGGHAAGTIAFNGSSSANRLFGAITKSSMVIWEYKV